MKSFMLLLLSFFLAVAASAQTDSKACASFHRGDFTYTNDAGQLVYLKRSGRIQTETIKENKTVTRLKIRWISDCTYEIKQVWSNSKALRKNNGSTTVVNISNVAKYSYEFSCECKGSSGPDRKGIVYKVNHGN